MDAQVLFNLLDESIQLLLESKPEPKDTPLLERLLEERGKVIDKIKVPSIK